MKNTDLSLLAVLAAALCLITLCSCAPRTGVRAPGEPTTGKAGIREQADRAWQAGNHRKARALYSELITDPSLPAGHRQTVYDRLVRSALASGDLLEARVVLTQWEQIPQPDQGRARLAAEAEFALAQDTDQAWKDFLLRLAPDTNIAWKIRSDTACSLAGGLLRRGNTGAFLDALALFARENGRTPCPPELFACAQTGLKDVPPQVLEQVLASRTERLQEFPYMVAAWQSALAKLDREPDLWPGLWPELVLLSQAECWPDPEEQTKVLEELTRKHGVPETHLALLLPLSGPYAAVGWKIAHGAGAAQWSLVEDGLQIRLTLINTQGPDWLNEVQNLPPACGLVGGPLRREAWEKLAENNAASSRAFFTFLPSIQDEGRAGWRFFSSPEDEIRALLAVTRDQLGIRNYGIFYPREDYGRVMAEAFARVCEASGARLNALESYDPDDHTAWNRQVAVFLRTQNLPEEELNPEPDFQALFLPDSLSRARQMISHFFYHDETRLIFLGPQIWARSLEDNPLVESEYFDLSLTPTAWWPGNPALRDLSLDKILRRNNQDKPDFWTALGYDFIRFAAGLSLPPGAGPDQVNNLLARRSMKNWALAPISWDAQGRAAQDMFVLQPSSGSLVPVHLESLKARRSMRQARRERLLQQLHPERTPFESKEQKP